MYMGHSQQSIQAAGNGVTKALADTQHQLRYNVLPTMYLTARLTYANFGTEFYFKKW